MCTMVYIGADAPLSEVAWDADSPGFHVCPLNDDESVVRGQFRLRHVVYAGSHGGCGCGFQPARSDGKEAPADPATELAQRRRSLAEFARYLRAELARLGKIELHVCRDGDGLEPPAFQRELTPSAIESQDFQFLQPEHSTIVPDAV